MNNVLRPAHFFSLARPLSRRRVRCRGQTLVEYALIISMVSIVVVGVIVNLGEKLKVVYSTIDSQVSGASAAAASVH